MDSDLLRRACGIARLHVYRENGSRPWKVEIPGWGGIHLDHPAVESYVADVLTGMVRERYGSGWKMVLNAADMPQPSILATPEQRITAALDVLPDD